MGFNSTSTNESSSSGTNEPPSHDIPSARLLITKYQFENVIENELIENFSNTRINLSTLFQTIHEHNNSFINDALNINIIVTKLLDFFHKNISSSGCDWAFPAQVFKRLEGDILWKTIDEMRANGALRKSMMGVLNDNYYAYVFINNKLENTEVMTVTGGFELRAENYNRVVFKDSFNIACQRYLQQQEFINGIRELLIDCMAKAEDFYISSEALNNTQKSLIHEILKVIKIKEYRLATQLVRLVTDLDELQKSICRSVVGSSVLEDVLISSKGASKKGESTVSIHKDLLNVISSKLIMNNKGFGGEANYEHIATLPRVYEEQASVFILSSPATFFDLLTYNEITSIGSSLKTLAFNLSNDFQPFPEQAFYLFHLARNRFIPQFNKMTAEKRKEMIAPFRGKDFSILYPLLTGDFSGKYIERPKDIHVKNRIRDWQEFQINISGLDLSDEFNEKMINNSSRPNVFHAINLLIDFEFYTPVLNLLENIGQNERHLVFNSIHSVLKRNIITFKIKCPDIKLIRVLIEINPIKMFEIFTGIEASEAIKFLDGANQSFLLTLNTYYHEHNRIDNNWSRFMAQLKKGIMDCGTHLLVELLNTNRNDLELLFMQEITILSEKKFHMNTFDKRLGSFGWFLLNTLSDAQIRKYAAEKGLALSLILKYQKEIFLQSTETVFAEKAVLAFCKSSYLESDLSLCPIVQESNRIFTHLMVHCPTLILLELIRLSSAESLSSVLENLSDTKFNMHSNSSVNQEALGALLAKVATPPPLLYPPLLSASEFFINPGHTLIASAPPAYEENYIPPNQYPNPLDQKINRLKCRNDELEQELEELKNRHEILLGKQPVRKSVSTEPSIEIVQQLLAAQTKTIIEALKKEPEKIRALEVENQKLKRSLQLKEKLIFSNKFSFKVADPVPPDNRIKRSNSFS